MNVSAIINLKKFEAWTGNDKTVTAEFNFLIPGIDQAYSPPVRMSIPLTDEMIEHKLIFEILIKEQIQKIVKDGNKHE